ncbi:hypothetical protein B0H21DRAFT_718721 [Amylocystis lapponica]|nr:hypothetical protein B0H21DRAFT_718721 [Amylocystis lapponica]
MSFASVRSATRTVLGSARPRAAMSAARFSSAPATRIDSPLKAANQQGTGPAPSYAPVGVAAALEATASTPAKSTLFAHEFSLADRVALVSGGNRGIGLEMAMALAEAGARAVYCVDLPKQPGGEWHKVQEYLGRIKGKTGEGRLEYVSADVRNQDDIWKIGETIGDKEGRLDVCVAAAGILKPDIECLEYPAEVFKDVIDVNVNGVLFTAQAAGRQMARFGKGQTWMGRSMACELDPDASDQGVRH